MKTDCEEDSLRGDMGASTTTSYNNNNNINEDYTMFMSLLAMWYFQKLLDKLRLPNTCSLCLMFPAAT